MKKLPEGVTYLAPFRAFVTKTKVAYPSLKTWHIHERGTDCLLGPLIGYANTKIEALRKII